MGLAKNQMIEDEERGWHEPDGHVCGQCVYDDFLKSVIADNLNQRKCDYCGRITSTNSAAPVAVLMPHIADAIHCYFAEPTGAGVPYDGGWIIEPIDTAEMLYSLPLDCDDRLFDDVIGALTNDYWVASADGHWASSHPHEILHDSWASFEQSIKHGVRYFFQELPPAATAGPQEIGPGQMLSALEGVIRATSLVTKLSCDLPLFRVRARESSSTWPIEASELGAPPDKLACGGRMNPPGISYLYLAFERSTALAEVLSAPPCSATVATFQLTRDVAILDLVNLPPMPSVFDTGRRNEREMLLFLAGFVTAISRPIRKNGMEHVEYVPSQVVCEFFATVFQPECGAPLDGIAYPSAVLPGGKNLVLFPTDRGFDRKFDQAAFQMASELHLPTWKAFMTEIR